MSLARFLRPGEYQLTVPDDVYFINIEALGAGAGFDSYPGYSQKVRSTNVPVSPGDTITAIVGGGPDSTGAGGYPDGGDGFSGSHHSQFYPYDLVHWTTAGGGSTRVLVNGVEMVVSGGAAAPGVWIAQSLTDPGPFDPFPYYDEPYFYLAWGSSSGDHYLASSMPGPGDRNRAPRSPYTGYPFSPGGPADLVQASATAGGGSGGGSGATATKVDSTSILVSYSGSGGGGYGGGGGGHVFRIESGPTPDVSYFPAPGRPGTSYSLYPATITEGFGGAEPAYASITWAEKPEMHLGGPANWDGKLEGGEIPENIRFNIIGTRFFNTQTIPDPPYGWPSAPGPGYGIEGYSGDRGIVVVTAGEFAAYWDAYLAAVADGDYIFPFPNPAKADGGNGPLYARWQWEIYGPDGDLVGEDPYGPTANFDWYQYPPDSWFRNYVLSNGEAPPPGRYRIRARVQSPDWDDDPDAGIAMSDWAEHFFTVGPGGFWSVGKASWYL